MKKNLGFIILWIAWAGMACFLYSAQVQIDRLDVTTPPQVVQVINEPGLAARVEKLEGKMDNLPDRVGKLEDWQKSCQ